jgi:transcriptional/translational regulatory protein YebC/TACO1
VITISKGNFTDDDLMNVILEAGADDLSDQGEYYEVTAPVESFEPVRKAIEAAGYKIDNASLQYVPRNTTKVEGKEAEQTVKLISVIEDNEMCRMCTQMQI